MSYVTYNHDNIFYITDDGKVGINNNAPDYGLHTVGDIFITGAANGSTDGIQLTSTSTSTYRNVIAHTDEGLEFTNTSANGANRDYSFKNGRVGIGVTNPAREALQVADGIRIEKTENAPVYMYSNQDETGYYIEQLDNNSGKANIRLQTRPNNTGGYTRLTIDADAQQFSLAGGNVNIISSIDQKIILDGSSSPYIRWREKDVGDTAYIQWVSQWDSLMIHNVHGRDIDIRGNGDPRIRLRDSAGNVRGGFYADSSNNVGILDAGLSWAVRVINDQGVALASDDNTDIFVAGVDLVTGSHGTVQTEGAGKDGWSGYSINGRAVFMHDNDNQTGLWDDVNDGWFLSALSLGKTSLYYNKGERLMTSPAGVAIDAWGSDSNQALLIQQRDTNGTETGIRITSQIDDSAAGYTQYGEITYQHDDNNAYGHGNTLKFYGTDSRTAFVFGTHDGDTSNKMLQASLIPGTDLTGQLGHQNYRWLCGYVNTLYIDDGLYHNGDTNTSIRFSGNDIVSVSVGGVERLQVNENGVNITGDLVMTNTTDDVNLAEWVFNTQGLHSVDRNNYITLYGDKNEDHSISSRDLSGNNSDDIRINTYGSFFVNLDSNSNNTGAADFVVGRHGATGTITDNNTMLTIDGETGRMTIKGMTTNDFTAIRTTLGGTNTDTYYTDWQAAGGFTVKRAVGTAGDLSIGIDTTDGSKWTGTGGDIHFKTNKSGTYGDRVTIKSGGDVGIGTNDPNTPLHIYRGDLGVSGVIDMLKLEANRSDIDLTPVGLAMVFKHQDSNNTTNEARIKSMAVNDTDYGDNDEGTSNLVFETTDGGVAEEHVIITGRGEVGIGTMNPTAALDIVRPDTEIAELKLRGGAQGSGRLYVGQSNTTGAGLMYNGDDNPDELGAGDDVILFRRASSVDHAVIKWDHDSSVVYFSDDIHVPSSSRVYTSNLKALDGSGNGSDGKSIMIEAGQGQDNTSNNGEGGNSGDITLKVHIGGDGDDDGDGGAGISGKIILDGPVTANELITGTITNASNLAGIAASSYIREGQTRYLNLQGANGSSSGSDGQSITITAGSGGNTNNVDAGDGGDITLRPGARGFSSNEDDGSDGQIILDGGTTIDGDVSITGNITGPTDIYAANKIIHTGDTDTYMQFSAANEWCVVAGNSERLRVDSTGVRLINGGLSMYNDSKHGSILRPRGGFYQTTTNVNTGAIRVKLPAAVSTGQSDMMTFWVDVYDHTEHESFSVFIGGYNHQSEANNANNLWVNCTAWVLGRKIERNLKVRFGSEGNSKCVWIGENDSVWNYPVIQVRDVTVGYTADVNLYDDDWAVGIDTSPEYVEETITDTLVASRYSLNSDKLDGEHGSYYLDANNITGTINDASLPSKITSNIVASDVTLSNDGSYTRGGGIRWDNSSRQMQLYAREYDSENGGEVRVVASWSDYGGIITGTITNATNATKLNGIAASNYMQDGGNTYNVNIRTPDMDFASGAYDAESISIEAGAGRSTNSRDRGGDSGNITLKTHLGGSGDEVDGLDGKIILDGTTELKGYVTADKLITGTITNATSLGGIAASSYIRNVAIPNIQGGNINLGQMHLLDKILFRGYDGITVTASDDNDIGFISIYGPDLSGYVPKTTPTGTTSNRNSADNIISTGDGWSDGQEENIDGGDAGDIILKPGQGGDVADQDNSGNDGAIRLAARNITIGRHNDTLDGPHPFFASGNVNIFGSLTVSSTFTVSDPINPFSTLSFGQDLRCSNAGDTLIHAGVTNRNFVVRGGSRNTTPNNYLHFAPTYSNANQAVYRNYHIDHDWQRLNAYGEVLESGLDFEEVDHLPLYAGQIAAAGELRVNGDVVAFYDFSDAQLKQDITTLDSDESLSKILKLQGVSYKWRGAPDAKGTQIGLIAQEVEQIVPEVVSSSTRAGDEQKYKRVDYDKLVSLLIESVKSQQAQIDTLKEEIEQLKQQ